MSAVAVGLSRKVLKDVLLSFLAASIARNAPALIVTHFEQTDDGFLISLETDLIRDSELRKTHRPARFIEAVRQLENFGLEVTAPAKLFPLTFEMRIGKPKGNIDATIQRIIAATKKV